MRVLIVDDHESFRRLAARMLAEAGFAVVREAVDAASALRAAARLAPDVVLLDVVLPDRSGLAVAAQLAAAPAPPRVILTLSVKTVETHVRHILAKLTLPADAQHNRRVLAVLAYLRESGDAGSSGASA
jgi:DNA-binding NarL/FixJ family response regulator